MERDRILNLKVQGGVQSDCSHATEPQRQQIEVNAKAKGGITPLHLAAFCQNVEVATLLLERTEINLDARTDEEGMAALHMSAWSGSDTIVARILAAHRRTKNEEQLRPIINMLDKLGRTPLHYAAYRRRLDVAKELLKSPAIDVNTEDRDCFTALHLASRKGHVDLVELLMHQREIDPNKTASSNEHTLKSADTLQENLEKTDFGELPRPKLTDYMFIETCSRKTALHFALRVTEEELTTKAKLKEVIMLLVNALLVDPNTDITIENSKLQMPVELAMQRKMTCLGGAD
ncbi:hypothetical protein R1sor_020495 [Riccia sorocarpa]|uniref:Ankyrin repeat protein n=1 Tax=Riccia sorocarpa TaxID=122646 RepID=A0ABD3IFH5_9MARC